MLFEHLDRFFILAASGLGLFLAGALNLAFGRNGCRAWLRAAVTVAVCGAVVAGLATLARPVIAARAGGAMFGVILFAFLLGSDWLTRHLSSVVSFFRKPAARWSLVAASGLIVALASGVTFDRAEVALADQSMKNLELAVGRSPAQPATHARATTDRGSQIVLMEPISPRDSSELADPEGQTLRGLKCANQLIRRSGPTDLSNCHGWVFTGGKFLLSPDDVEQIVKENGYTETHDPHPGDLVVYRQSGTVAHTAIVRYVSEGQPVLVEGKWGTMGVFLHPADQSCYGTEYTFHRSARGTHLLVGVGGSPAGPNAVQPAVAE